MAPRYMSIQNTKINTQYIQNKIGAALKRNIAELHSVAQFFTALLVLGSISEI